LRQKKESNKDKSEGINHDFDSFHVAVNMYNYKKQQTQQQKMLANEFRGKGLGSKKYVDLTKKNSDFTDSLTINESLSSNEENIETSDLNSSLVKKKHETKSSRKDLLQSKSKKLGSKIGSKNNLNVNYIGEIDNNEKMI